MKGTVHSSIMLGIDSKIKFSSYSLGRVLQERPALHKVLLSGNLELVESFLTNEIALEERYHGMTVLHYAARE